jgi:hypothetical protein
MRNITYPSLNLLLFCASFFFEVTTSQLFFLQNKFKYSLSVFSVAHQRLRPDFPLLFDQLFPSSDPDPLLQIHDLRIAVVELVVGQFDISPAPDLFHSGNDRLGYAKVGILSIEFGVCSGKLTRGQEGEQTLAFRGPRKVPEQQKNTENISF